jgi:hypothetical protein
MVVFELELLVELVVELLELVPETLLITSKSILS